MHPRTVKCIVLCILLLSGAALASIPVTGGGTLSFFIQNQIGNCVAGKVFYNVVVARTFENFSYTDPSGNVTALSGSATATDQNQCYKDYPGTATLTSPAVTVYFVGDMNGTATASLSSVVGYVNPKYVVIGVQYSPPGSSSSVKYTQNTVVGNTTVTSSSFSNKVSTSVSLSSSAGIPGFFSGKETTTISGSYAQQSGASKTVAVSQTVSNTTGLNGYTDPVNGVNHDYDYIFVWLNPIAMYTIYFGSSSNNITWNGYGYDLTDQRVYNDMDVIGIPVGCINGDLPKSSSQWAVTCNDIASVYARTWALNNTDGSNPGLTSADLNNILKADPFYTTYTPTLGSGSYTTTDGRFTECHTTGCTETIDFEPNLSDTYSQGYSTNTTNTQNYSHTETFAIAQQFSTSVFWKTFSLSLQASDEMTWVYSSSYSVNNSQGQTAAFTIVGPNPGYGGPLQFVAFQDNYFGTFMFYP
jgi:hypothetical protein